MRKPQTSLSHLNRRQFLRRAGATSALFSLAPSSFLRGAQPLAPGEKINIAGIGIGSRGGVDVDEVAAEGHDFVALSEVEPNNWAKWSARIPRGRRLTNIAS